MSKKNVLIVEDDQKIGSRIRKLLSGYGYHAVQTDNGINAIQIISQDNIGVVFLDLLLPDINGMELLKEIHMLDPSIAVIMMSQNGTLPEGLKAAELGAFDWLQKPFRKERIIGTVRKAMATFIPGEDPGFSSSDIWDKYHIVGSSPAIKRICKTIDKVASQNTTILITGESGTGKEMVAYAIHLNSLRAHKPFVCINCAAVHETLIESELFGHKRGSFTGAYASKKGKFQLADKGTLFLDEIGDLSASAQAKLLRTIETGEVESLGTESMDKVDVRIISATNKDINELVERGVFREDLFHRINVIEINIPPLRERPEDILPLVIHFLEEIGQEKNQKPKELTTGAEAMLLSHHWSGNVRELRNIIEKIMVLVDSYEVTGQHIAEFIGYPNGVKGMYGDGPFKKAIQCFEKNYIMHALWENRGNISRTADILKIPRSCLYEKMKKYNIQRIPENRTVHL